MRSSRVVTSFAFIGMVLTAIACNRVASQKNFLGAACRDQSECPSDLTCRDGFCRAFCSAGAKCPTPGEECINGACVPPQSGNGTDGPAVSSGGDAGTGTPSGGDFDARTEPQQNGNVGDGTLARSGLPNAINPDFSFVASDTKVYYAAPESGGLGTPKTYIWEADLGSTTAPTKVVQIAGGAGDKQGLALANGGVFYLDSNPQPQLCRKTVGNADPPSCIQLSGGMPRLTVWGTKIPYVDFNGKIRLLDTTGAADAVQYFDTTGDEMSFAAVTGNTFWWLIQGKGAPSKIYKRTVGDNVNAATNPYTLDDTIQSLAFGASNNTVAILAGQGPFSIATLDAAHPGPQPNVIAQDIVDNTQGGAAFDGAYMYLAESPDMSAGKPSTNGTPIVRVNIEDGTKTEVARWGGDFGQPPRVSVTATRIYWVEPDGATSSGKLMYKAKP